ncbi:hypothetical protein cyc_02845 [Cyclospora cayetanensis]|uniref:Uncharacterized protein n=1 Tax=Cyclospora cayetanensis TaxID=88456 RepID=A0A1D3CZM9_9EIME|nr:hypothetical protein cyc_02845 [Cyclospora cayetanensis]
MTPQPPQLCPASAFPSPYPPRAVLQAQDGELLLPAQPHKGYNAAANRLQRAYSRWYFTIGKSEVKFYR